MTCKTQQKIDGDDEIAFRKVTPPDNPRVSTREDVLEGTSWITEFPSGPQPFVWEVESAVNYIVHQQIPLGAGAQITVKELNGNVLVDRDAGPGSRIY